METPIHVRIREICKIFALILLLNSHRLFPLLWNIRLILFLFVPSFLNFLLYTDEIVSPSEALWLIFSLFFLICTHLAKVSKICWVYRSSSGS